MGVGNCLDPDSIPDPRAAVPRPEPVEVVVPCRDLPVARVDYRHLARADLRLVAAAGLAPALQSVDSAEAGHSDRR